MFVAEKSAEGEELKPKRLVYCASHIQAMQNQKKQCHDLHPVTIAWLMSWDDNYSHGMLLAVSGSRVSLGFNLRFTRNMDSWVSPSAIKGKTTYLGWDIIQRGSKQRTQEAEIIKRLGDWFSNYQFNLSCFIFSLLFMHFVLAMSG